MSTRVTGRVVPEVMQALDEQGRQETNAPLLQESGMVVKATEDIVLASGLPRVRAEELLRFPGDLMGMAYNLDEDEVGIILMDEGTGLRSGDEVRRSGRLLDVPVGESLLGRVVDPLGRPLDGKRAPGTALRYPVERPAPPVMHRAPVEEPLQTGVTAVDALIPIGRGQRELILGDRQTGKTTLAMDTILNQKDSGVICIYCAVGKQKTAVAGVVENLRSSGAMDHTIVVCAEADVPAGLQFVAPYAATSMGEYFMERGRDVLVVYDDLTWHARAYRQLALLLRRPPGREAYPGDIFHVHARLLERSTRLREEYGGGSLTALPIIETQSQNISSFIPTNLISITDGQIYLSPELFRKDVLPAVDVGLSVSRVGGAAQLPYYRTIAQSIKLEYMQFLELEAFARFSGRLDEESRRRIARGERIREILRQPPGRPLPVAGQVLLVHTVSSGLADDLELEQLARLREEVPERVYRDLPEIARRITQGVYLDEEDRRRLHEVARQAVEEVR